MGVLPSQGKLLYHVTSLNNLESILTNGLLSREELLKQKLIKDDIADLSIIEKRKQLNILQYVPFHFYEKTAFTGRVYKNNPNMTFCVIAITRNLAQKGNFKICTAHPLSYNPEAVVYDNYIKGIEAIDWEKMDARNFVDRESQEVGMAECLAPSPLLSVNFHCIYVPSEKIKLQVSTLAKKILRSYDFFIDVMPEFTQEGKPC